jgi:hypothetical protein
MFGHFHHKMGSRFNLKLKRCYSTESMKNYQCESKSKPGPSEEIFLNILLFRGAREDEDEPDLLRREASSPTGSSDENDRAIWNEPV